MQITILGGTGFVGRALCRQLATAGHGLRVLTRKHAIAKPLWVLPALQVIETDVHDAQALRTHLAGSDAVVNLIGVLHDRPAGAFAQCHVDLPRKVFEAARSAGVPRVLHMSALGASDLGPSQYLRSRGRGELAAQAAMADLAVTVFRPSVIFGAEDRFTNLFAQLLRIAPILPLAGADVRFQPVWVEDVARALTLALADPGTHAKTYELGGPAILTLREIVEAVAHARGRPARVLGLSPGIARLQARLMEWLPGPPLLTRDNLASMSVDNVCGRWPLIFSPGPTPLAAVLARTLGVGDPRAGYDRSRARARR
jgi:NADH dehydrogenase